MDLTTVTASLGSIKTAIDIAKSLKNTDLSLEKAETKLQLAELVSAIADAKIQIADFQDLVLSKEQDNKKLLEQLFLKENIIYDGKMYWISKENEKDNGPFCQKCQDTDNNADMMVTPCPLCHLKLDTQTKHASEAIGREVSLPVLHMQQMVGLALGCTPAELGLKHHLTDVNFI